MHRLLVIKPSSLGDIVHGLQVAQIAARARPDLHISWVVRERFAGLVEAAPFVAERIIFRRRDGWPAFVKLLRHLRTLEFDSVWDMQGLLRSGLMTAAARAPQKWGRTDAREGADWFYNRRIALPKSEGPHHAIEILLPFLEALDVRASLDERLELRPDAAFGWSDFFRKSEGPCFVIFTDSRGAEKKWPHFASLMKGILDTVPGSRIAWCAGQRTEPPVEAAADRFLNLTGCPLDEMIALVRQPSVFIGNDSGPMHLSAACGNHVLAIFGPTSPRRFGPYPLESPRHLAVSAPEGKLEDLRAETVLEAAQELLRRSVKVR